jgi:hypothetical protein
MRTSKLVMLAALSVSFLALAAPASAQTACWNTAPFCDIVQVDFQVRTSGQVDMAGKWYACPPNPGDSYFLPVAGALSPTAIGAYRIGWHGTHNTGFFGGFRDCIIDAQITAPSFGGTWTMDCGGGGFVNTGDLVLVACEVANVSSQVPAGR